jgi:5'-nucleotidase
MAPTKKTAPTDKTAKKPGKKIAGRRSEAPLRILVTNDDGINAPGLKVLENIARKLSSDVWVVAPELEQSGASHSLTLHDPLRVRKVSSRRFAVSGTPTDCVVMGISQILIGAKPTLLLSGVNRGANLADDVTYSGTIAAAMEGTLLGVRSIALSQVYWPGNKVRWSTAEHHAPNLIKKLLKVGWPDDVLLNINFPDRAHDAVTGTEVSLQGNRDASSIVIHDRKDPRGNDYFWIGFRRPSGKPGPNTDMSVVYEGGISITPLKLDLTHRATRKALKAALS